MRRYQKGMVLMVEHILFAVLTAAVIGAAIFMWWFENHDEKTDSGNEKRRELSYYEYRINYFAIIGSIIGLASTFYIVISMFWILGVKIVRRIKHGTPLYD